MDERKRFTVVPIICCDENFEFPVTIISKLKGARWKSQNTNEEVDLGDQKVLRKNFGKFKDSYSIILCVQDVRFMFGKVLFKDFINVYSNENCNLTQLYTNTKSAYMVRPIFTSIMIDLSIYLNQQYPGESFAIMMDNASCHGLVKQLPFENLTFVMLPPNCTVSGINNVI